MTELDLHTSKKNYYNAYNASRKGDVYYTLMKQLNNKLSYLRKKRTLTDDNEEYKVWRLMYPELLSIKETFENINIILSNNKTYDHDNIKYQLHEFIDSLIL